MSGVNVADLPDSVDSKDSVKDTEVLSAGQPGLEHSQDNQSQNQVVDESLGSKEPVDSSGIENTTQSSDYNVISREENHDVIALAEGELTKLNVENNSDSRKKVEQFQQASKSEDLTKSEKELKKLCTNMFAKLEDYLKGEVASSVDDYALLEKMNRSTALKYQEMSKVSANVAQAMHEVNGKVSSLRPHLEQIEEIEQEVLALEQAAYKLDGYAKRLEERFKKLEKR